MAGQHTVYVGALFTAAFISALVFVYAWRRRATPGGFYFALLMLNTVWWAFTSGMEASAAELATKIVWSKFQYLSIPTTAPLWLLFAITYSQHDEWLTRRRQVLLWVIPLIVMALAATNERHRLIWTSVTPVSTQANALARYEHGPGVWINIAYAYTLLLIGSVLLIRTTLRSSRLYRYQAAALLTAVAISWIGNAIYVAGVFGPYDLTPLSFTITGLLVAWSMFRYQLLDLAPVARDALVARMVDGVLVTDQQNRIVDINPAAQYIIGATAAIIGQPVEAALAAWPDLLARYQGAPGAQTEVMLGSAAAPRWFDTRISLLYDRRKRATGRLIVLRDITERKQAEQALLRYTHELEASNAELDAFAHTVAHDLKNPLNTLIGYSSLLADHYEETPPDTQRDFLRAIASGGEKMAAIVNELLLLASVRRVEDVKTQPLDMASIVAEARQRLSNLIEEYRAEIVVPNQWPTAIGYGPWVEEVWINYISNALKYGGQPEQDIPPHIELGFDHTDGSHIRFWVRDNGLGLAPEEQERLFAEFTRLHQVQVEGYGLGLSIVRRIVERLGGRVGVESQAGQGSTFYFTLPAQRPE